MREYFNMLESIYGKVNQADIDIAKLSKEIAILSGYHITDCELKNGVVVKKVVYNEPFDSRLSAQWVLYYQKSFKARLSRHNEFKEFQVDIINDVFISFMNSLNLLNLDSRQITKCVNISIINKISNLSKEIGSSQRLTDYDNNINKHRIRACKVASFHCDNIDDIEENRASSIDYDSGIIMDIQQRLRDNPYCQRVLDAMLCNNCRFIPDAVDKALGLSNDEWSMDTRRYIQDAYNTIKSVLHMYVGDNNDYNWKPLKVNKFRLSRGKQC